MPDISATEAARNFSSVLDAVEHRGERFTIVRHGRVVAHLQPAGLGRGRKVKEVLATYSPDGQWRGDLQELRGLLEVEERS